jgi:hypothetical protein
MEANIALRMEQGYLGVEVHYLLEYVFGVDIVLILVESVGLLGEVVQFGQVHLGKLVMELELV